MRQRMKYLWLLEINLFISSFTFGGGYVVAPMIRKYYVEKKGLSPEEELVEMTAIAQSSPGATAINLSGSIGYRVGGVPGAAISCLAAATPPLVIPSAIFLWYFAFSSNSVTAAVLDDMEAGVAVLIVDLVTGMCQMTARECSWLLTAIIPTSSLANFVCYVNVTLVLAACCGVCVMRIWWERNRERGGESTC